ncbi:hypothetical protein [Antarctobacter sp.]|uniref:hypothetical protein n=1 Tax=Antarctobacter sp. TaxID=1872577 RepID=UPI002B26501A|nr:hypothetical protein [Antarctobacter sp.]
METENKHFKLNVPIDLYGELKKLAVRESRSMTSQINLMLRRQLGAEEHKKAVLSAQPQAATRR